MNILITGGTGFVGSYLRTHLLREGHMLTIITRSPKKYKEETAKNQRFVSWDADLPAEMNRADVVINLAGASIFGRRWTQEVTDKIYNSCINCTQQLVAAIDKAEDRPSLMVSASGADYYGDSADNILDESAEAGDSFLAKVCIAWEKAAEPVTNMGVRLAIPRIAVVLERDGGALEQVLLPFKLGLGGASGSGTQYFPWIHMLDLCRGLSYPIENQEFEGPYNLSAPNPVTMSEFANELADQLNRPSIFRVPEFALNVALGEAANPIITSKRLQPKKLQQHGFEFRFNSLKEALGDIL